MARNKISMYLDEEEEIVASDAEETVEETPEEESTEETVDETDKDAEIARLKAINARLSKKSEKPKVEVKEDKSNTPTLSYLDNKALSDAGIADEDDYNEVLEYADYKKMTVAQALQSPVLKNLLAEKFEERKTANASHTGTTKRSSTPTEETLLNNASKGQLPDSEDDLAKLVKARLMNKGD